MAWRILLSTIVIVGSFAFWGMQSQVLTRGPRPPTRVRILPGQWAFAELAWILFMLANVLASRPVGRGSLESWFAWSIRFEALWAVLIIAAVGLLTSLSPP